MLLVSQMKPPASVVDDVAVPPGIPDVVVPPGIPPGVVVPPGIPPETDVGFQMTLDT